LFAQHPVLQEIFQFQGWKEDVYLGWGLVNPGDLNNDGYDEFISYNPNTDSVLFFWGAYPVDTVPDLVFHERGPVWPKQFSKVEVANIDGDSLQELIIPFWGSTKETYIYKLGMNADSLPDIILNYGGENICNGDLNGDGYDDIILSYPDSVFSSGHIRIFLGGEPFDTQPDYEIIGDTVLMRLGMNIITGDLNGDSFDDLIVLGNNLNIHTNFDYIRIYLGSAVFDTVYDYHMNDPSHDPWSLGFDHWNMTAFDYNQDSYDDLFVGGLYVYNGSVNFDTIPEFHIVWFDSSWNIYGGSRVFDAGDINNDSYPDLAIGMDGMFGGKGLVHIRLSGRHGFEKNYIICEPNVGDGFGHSVVNIGDLDGNGVSDLLIGEPGYILHYRYGKLHFYSGDSTLISTGLEKDWSNIPETVELLQNYPNPFNNSTVIAYKLTEKSQILLSIYNVQGELVKILYDNILTAGEHKVSWDGRDRDSIEVASGIYFYQLKATHLVTNQTSYQIRKMIYLK
jgi:hypothetical protein